VKVISAVVGVVAAVVAALLVGTPVAAAPRSLPPPTGLTATAPSSTEIALSWTAVSGVPEYQVLRGSARGGPYTAVAVVTTPSYVDRGRAPATTYYYVVRSKDRTKVSGNSAEVSATTPPAVSAVSGFRGAVDGTRVVLQWLPVTGAVRYDVLRVQTIIDTDGQVVGSTTTPGFTETGLTADYWYVYRVRAVFAGGSWVGSVPLTMHTGAATRLELTVSPEPTEASQAALLVATVTPATPITARFSGDVEFFADDASVGRGSISSTGSVRYATLYAILPAGTHTVYAHYGGYSFSGTSLGASSSAVVTHRSVPDHGGVSFAGAAVLPYGAGSSPAAVAVADVTGDGRSDVLATTTTRSLVDPDDFSLFVFAQQPDGGLAQSQVLRTHASTLSAPVRLTTGDVDGDGDTDVAVTGGTGVDLVVQDGGRLAAPRLLPVDGGTVQDAVLADLDRDGLSDLVIGHLSGVVARRNLGGGSFAAPVPVHPSGSGHVEVGDLTGDGRPDIVVTASWTAEVYAQTADGGFARHTTVKVPIDHFGIGSLAVGDATGDGRADLVATVSANVPEAQVVVYPQTSAGGLGAPIRYASYDVPEPVVVSDVDGDGRPDVVIGYGGWYAAGVLLQRPDGLLGRSQKSWVPYASHYDHRGLAVGDVTGDGRPDVVLADYNHGLVVLRQT
jgi:fibronectin type 3 domain-containing protein